MRRYNCNSCYIGNSYGGKCVAELPQIAEPPINCLVFNNIKNCDWVQVEIQTEQLKIIPNIKRKLMKYPKEQTILKDD